jgi:GAF domain-containing protein
LMSTRRRATNYGFSPELEAFARANPFPIDGASTTIRAAMSGSAVQAVDVLADETQGWLAREYQRLGGHRTNLGVPLRRDGETIGVFTLTRQVVRPFTVKLGSSVGGSWAKNASRRSSSRTNERNLVLELARGRKFVVNSSSWDENRVFLEDDKLEVAVKNGRWVMTHLPAGSPPKPAPVEHHFPTE